MKYFSSPRRAILIFSLFAALSMAAQNTASIKGRMFDEKGEPISFALVRIDGTTMALNTDAAGNFEFKNLAAGNYVIIAQYLGYNTNKQAVKLAAGESKQIKIDMQPDNKKLNEVVVVGYGTQVRREVTGAVAKIGSRDITAIPVASVEASLQGKAAGVQISVGSGLSGAAAVVKIRGIASVSAGSDPLYVVDGIPISQDYFMQNATDKGNGGGKNNNPLASINPNDIESIEVLKDAAATAIYGSRGSNGVIIITTKRGKKKGWKFDATIREGISTMASRPEMMNNTEYLQMLQEAYENDGGIGRAPLPAGLTWDQALNTNTDWIKETTRTGIKQNYSLGTSYGAKKFNAFFNATRDNNTTYIIGDAYIRSSARLNLDYQLTKNIKVSYLGSYVHGLNKRVDGGWGGGLGAAMSTALPIYPIKNDDGGWFTGAGINNNPVFMRENKTQQTVQQRTLQGLVVDITPLKNLVIHLNGNYDYLTNIDDVFEDTAIVKQPKGIAKRGATATSNYNVIATASYLQNLNKGMKLTYLVGTEYQRTNSGFKYLEYNNIDGPLYNTAPADSSLKPGTNVLSKSISVFDSYFGRINYALKDKYFVSLNGRADYSSTFGPNYRWGFFPAIGTGWIVSDEKFLKGNKVLTFLKARASYGKSGNSNFGGSYPWWGRYKVVPAVYNGVPDRYVEIFENPDFHWETTKTFDLGLDYSFFNDRITGVLEFYNKNTQDVILNITVPAYFGFESSTYAANVGKINNRGIEFAAKIRVIDRPKLRYTLDFNIARNYNKVLDIGSYTEEAVSGGTNDTRIVEGQPVGTNYLVRFSRIDPNSGKPIYLDKNGNETYKWDPANRVPVGNIYPKAFGGWNNSMIYNRWELDANFVYSIGGKIYDSSSKRQLGTYDTDNWNHRRDQFDRWQKPGDEAEYPVLTRLPANHGSSTPWINTDMWLKDASYIRLRSLSLFYSFTESQLKKLKIATARVGFVSTNVIVFTKFRGVDPEVVRDFENATDRNTSPNITYLTPPQERTNSISIVIGF
jgi:TonB-linked SusC/RagA family outer membrane protein